MDEETFLALSPEEQAAYIERLQGMQVRAPIQLPEQRIQARTILPEERVEVNPTLRHLLTRPVGSYGAGRFGRQSAEEREAALQRERSQIEQHELARIADNPQGAASWRDQLRPHVRRGVAEAMHSPEAQPRGSTAVQPGDPLTTEEAQIAARMASQTSLAEFLQRERERRLNSLSADGYALRRSVDTPTASIIRRDGPSRGYTISYEGGYRTPEGYRPKFGKNRL